MTLISLAITVAFGTSLAATFGLFEIDVWWELASLITIMVLGHWLEMRAISQARGALNALAALLPDITYSEHPFHFLRRDSHFRRIHEVDDQHPVGQRYSGPSSKLRIPRSIARRHTLVCTHRPNREVVHVSKQALPIGRLSLVASVSPAPTSMSPSNANPKLQHFRISRGI